MQIRGKWTQGHKSRAPTAAAAVGEAKIVNDRQPRQDGMNRSLQDTVPLTMNDAHLVYAAFCAEGKIFGDQRFTIPRRKGMKIEAAIDRQLDDFGKLSIKTHTLFSTKGFVLLTLIFAGATTPPETMIFIASSTPNGAG